MKIPKNVKIALTILPFWGGIALIISLAVAFPLVTKYFLMGAWITLALVCSWKLIETYFYD